MAFDTGGPAAVRPFIRPAEPIAVPAPMRAIMGWRDEDYARAKAPAYPCLIDERHAVAEAYDMPNVPMAVWIDEEGRIVRPAEPAGATDGFRALDRTTYTLAEDVAEAGRAARARYLAAIRDWVRTGAARRSALAPDAARERVAAPSEADARAAATFRLAHHLRETGREDAALRWFGEAKRLAPGRWNYVRQAMQLEPGGNPSGPEFVAALRALGERRYYAEIDL